MGPIGTVVAPPRTPYRESPRPTELVVVRGLCEGALALLPRLRRRAYLHQFFRPLTFWGRLVGVDHEISTGIGFSLMLLPLFVPALLLFFFTSLPAGICMSPPLVEIIAWALWCYRRYEIAPPDEFAKKLFDEHWTSLGDQYWHELGDWGRNLFPIEFKNVKQLERYLKNHLKRLAVETSGSQ